MAVAKLFIYFVFFNTCIPNHIHTITQYIHPSPFTEASPHCTCAQWGKTSLGCRAEIRTLACLTSRPAHYQLSYAAPPAGLDQQAVPDLQTDIRLRER